MQLRDYFTNRFSPKLEQFIEFLFSELYQAIEIFKEMRLIQITL